jgi:hypothetical protein
MVCFGEDRINETLHLLNDLRNIDAKVYLLTNQNIDMEYYQFDNVNLFKTENEFNDFERYKIILKAFTETESDIVYHLDCDSRFFNCYNQKFDLDMFEKTLKSKSFDIMCSWFLEPIKTHLEKPDMNENKDIRNFKYGFDNLITFFKNKCETFEETIQKGIPLETVLIFKKSQKMIDFLNEMIKIEPLVISEEEKINRKIKITGTGFILGIMSDVFKLNLISDELSYLYFKGNFIKEVFPFNFKIDKYKKSY